TSQVTWLNTMQTEARQEMYGQTGYDMTKDLTIDQTALTRGTDSNGNTTYSNSDVKVTVETSTGERRVRVTAHLTFKTLMLYPVLPKTVSMQRAGKMRAIR